MKFDKVKIVYEKILKTIIRHRSFNGFITHKISYNLEK